MIEEFKQRQDVSANISHQENLVHENDELNRDTAETQITDNQVTLAEKRMDLFKEDDYLDEKEQEPPKNKNLGGKWPQ